MQNTGSKVQDLLTAILILISVLMWVLIYEDVATAASYTDSAHGNTDPGYGVNRSGTGYAIGDCVNCHDSCDNEFMLFAPLYTSQSDNVCFQCHQSPIASVQLDMPNQYSYSCTHGGEPEGCPRSIGAAFRFIKEDGTPREQCNSTTGSSHSLTDIRSFLQGKWGFSGTLDNINPCSGCHNPHRAKKDWSCSLPSGHGDTSTWEVWGDEDFEKMVTETGDEFTGVYEPPYKKTGGREWPSANDAPNYVKLCHQCHWPRWFHPGPYSTRWGRYMVVSFWSTEGHEHGSAHDNPGPTDYGTKKSPYDDSTNYVLMCTDCHEPHGSPNYMLLRTCINGIDGISVTSYDDNNGWIQFCTACHQMSYPWGDHPGSACYTCHGHRRDYF